MSARLEDFLDLLPAPAETDPILNCRVLLRRGLEGHVFPARADEAQASRAASLVEAALQGSARFGMLNLSRTGSLERRAAVERDLVPQAFAVQGGGFLALERENPVWCSVNETDHLRIRAEAAGAGLSDAYRLATEVDALLGETLDYAFSPDVGYICAEIADWGTGLSASVTLHLPALALAGLVDRALRTALDSGLSVRGFWSDDSASSGALYELESPRGSWTDEESILVSVGDAADRIAGYEKGAREELMSHDPESVRDAVCRAYGIARYARRVGYDEGAETLSRLRLGAGLGLLEGFEGAKAAQGFYALRNAHLLKYLAKSEAPEKSEDTEKVRVEEIRALALRSLVADTTIVEVP